MGIANRKTEEIVYDQDKLMSVSENGGELSSLKSFRPIMNKEFKFIYAGRLILNLKERMKMSLNSSIQTLRKIECSIRWIHGMNFSCLV